MLLWSQTLVLVELGIPLDDLAENWPYTSDDAVHHACKATCRPDTVRARYKHLNFYVTSRCVCVLNEVCSIPAADMFFLRVSTQLTPRNSFTEGNSDPPL